MIIYMRPQTSSSSNMSDRRSGRVRKAIDYAKLDGASGQGDSDDDDFQENKIPAKKRQKVEDNKKRPKKNVLASSQTKEVIASNSQPSKRVPVEERVFQRDVEKVLSILEAKKNNVPPSQNVVEMSKHEKKSDCIIPKGEIVTISKDSTSPYVKLERLDLSNRKIILKESNVKVSPSSAIEEEKTKVATEVSKKILDKDTKEADSDSEAHIVSDETESDSESGKVSDETESDSESREDSDSEDDSSYSEKSVTSSQTMSQSPTKDSEPSKRKKISEPQLLPTEVPMPTSSTVNNRQKGNNTKMLCSPVKLTSSPLSLSNKGIRIGLSRKVSKPLHTGVRVVL